MLLAGMADELIVARVLHNLKDFGDLFFGHSNGVDKESLVSYFKMVSQFNEVF